MDFNNIQKNIELNTIMDSKPVANQQGIEIFSKICAGEDTSRYGKKVDTVMSFIKDTGNRAIAGDKVAQAELNNVQKNMIEAPLLKRLNIFDFMGEKIQVGIGEEVKYKQFNLEGNMSNIQATNGSFAFPTYDFETKVMSTKNITGGVVVDHYEFAHGNCDAIQVMNEQVVTDMMNKMFYDVQTTLYKSISDSTLKIKNFSEASGITKTAVDNAIKKARRFGGKVNILGDYSVISQMTDFVGFKTLATTDSTTYQYPEYVMEEILKTGLINLYKSCSITEIPNSYNYTTINTTTNFYDTYLPEGLLYFFLTGERSPLKIGIKGGLRSMAGQDINTAQDIVRYDLAFGTVSLLGYFLFCSNVQDKGANTDRKSVV